MAPLVSVIVPTFNYARYLPRALDSCLRQTHPALETIVVDDGSTDETPAVLARYGERIQTIRQPNAGVSAARNAALALSRGEYVAFLDADDWLPDDAIALRVAALAAHPQAGAVLTSVTHVRDGEDGVGMIRGLRELPSQNLHTAFLRREIPFTVCGALVRGDLARGFRFPEAISKGEDIAYFSKILFAAPALTIARTTAIVLHHPDSARHDVARIRAEGLALVSAIFDDPLYAGALSPLRREFLARRYLSLARSAFESGDWSATRRLYLRGALLRPRLALRSGYLAKFLRACLFPVIGSGRRARHEALD